VVLLGHSTAFYRHFPPNKKAFVGPHINRGDDGGGQAPSVVEAPRASALDLGNGLATPTAGPDTSIGSTAGMRGLTTSGEQLALQDDPGQVLCRRLVCVTWGGWGTDLRHQNDNAQPPVPMIINSSELRGAGFNLQEVIPPAQPRAARASSSMCEITNLFYQLTVWVNKSTVALSFFAFSW